MNWRNLSVGHEKYVRFSPTCDFSGFLGNKGMGRKVILDDAEQSVPTQGLSAPTDSVMEVEEAIAVDVNDLGTNSMGEAEDVDMSDTGANIKAKPSPKREHTASPSPAPRKRRRSGNAKPNSTEETDLRTPSGLPLTGRRTRSQVEVEVAVPPRNVRTPTNLKKTASHKSVVPESSASAKTASPVKPRSSARKSVPAIEKDNEEEPVSTKRASPKKPQKRKRHETESEEEQELSEEPTPGPSKPKPTQRPAQESSPVPTRVDNAPARGRRSAAQKADEKLKDIMPDVINFQKQMKRGVVVGDWEKAEKEQERVEKTKEEKEKLKENTREKAKETARRRRSDVRYVTSRRMFQQT